MNGSFDIIYCALGCYKAIYGDVKVPYGYVIAERDEAYPEETWGMRLGQKFHNIRHKGTYKEHRQKLIELGVAFTFHAKAKPVKFDVLLDTLSAYKAVHGDLKISDNYQIVVGDDAYPEDTWGMKLGQKLHDIRHKGTFKQHKQQLIELGVDFNSKQKPLRFGVLLSALSSYKSVFSNLKVPDCFEITEGDDRFPEVTWGMKLGQLLDRIIYNGMYKEHKQKLMKLGVEFNEHATAKPAEFDLLLMALTAYKKVNRDVKVPYSYAIAEDDDAFPEETWGMKLGRRLWAIKHKRLNHEHRQKLIELGVGDARPEFEVLFTALTAYKAVHGDVQVPVNYVISDGDVAYPEEAWGMQLGVNVMSIRHAGAFQEHKQKLIDLGVDFSGSGSGSGVSANKKRRRTS